MRSFGFGFVLVVMLVACGGDDDGGPAHDASAPRDGSTSADGSTGADGGGRDGGVAPADAETPPDGAVVSGDVWSGHRSGTRLRARIARSALGAEEFLGWRDTALGLDCTFRRAGDGALRCLPEESVRITNQLYFADASCTEPLVTTNTLPCGYPAHAIYYDALGCMEPPTVYGLGAEIPRGTTTYTRPSASDPCTVAPSLAGRTVVFARGPEVPPSAFVAGTLRAESTASGVDFVVLETTDGASQHWGLADAAGGFSCAVGALEGGELACLPTDTTQITTYYGDAACSAPVSFAYDPASCETFTHAAEAVSACPGTRRLFRLGMERALTDPLYRNAGSGCTTSSTFASSRFFDVGAALGASDFVAASEVSGGVRGVIEERLHRFGGGDAVRVRWADRTNGVPCEMDAIASDGVQRCVPDGAGAIATSGYFRDSSCTLPLVHVTGCTNGFARALDASMCPPRRSIYPIAGGYSGDIYRTAGGCSRVLRPSELGGSFAIPGDEIDPATLVQTETIIE